MYAFALEGQNERSLRCWPVKVSAFRLAATSRPSGDYVATLSAYRGDHWAACGVFVILAAEWRVLAALLRDHIEVITDGEIPAEAATSAETD